MRNRLVSILLILCMALPLLPAEALAAQTETMKPTESVLRGGWENDAAESAGRSISIENGSSLGSNYTFDIRLSGSISEGTVYVAVYKEHGQMKELKSFEPAAVIAVELNGVADTDTAGVIWVDDREIPLCAAGSIALHDTRNYVKKLDESHIAVGSLEYNGTAATAEYVDNELLLVAKDNVTFGQIEDLVSSYQGTIVGFIKTVGHYQVELANVPTTAKLNSLVAELQANPLLKDAYPNTVTELSPEVAYQHYPGDSWGGDSWNEGYPDGRNWGVEAINAPSAWKLLEQAHGSLSALPEVTIGVIDSVFDRTHRDLNFENCWGHSSRGTLVTDNTLQYARNAKDFDEYGHYAHGSHVAGTIAAVTNNGRGISGIAGDQPLYGVSLDNGSGKNKATMAFFKSNIARLLEADGCRRTVINYSQADNWGMGNGISASWERDALAEFLKDYLNKGYDFVIAAAAGNAFDKDAWENSGLCSITDSEIMARIIVVGAARMYNTTSGTFAFLSRGDTTAFNHGARIDVSAPGQNIYSTVPNVPQYSRDPTGNIGEWYDGDYMTMTGTSMATPHVSGIAALVWAANPNLTGAEVKQIILRTADIRLYEIRNDQAEPSTDSAGYEHPMVNAAHAVSEALNQQYRPQGTCGANLEWTFDSSAGTLTVSGSGAMADYSDLQEALPWHRYKNQITKVVLEDGVTSIGRYAFALFKKLRDVEIGSTVASIGECAFLYCEKLSAVSVFPETLSNVGPGAFYGTALTELYFSGNPPRAGTAAAGEGEASFAYGERGDTGKITLYYPLEYQDAWDADRDGYWEGYHAEPIAVTASGTVLDFDTSQPVENALVRIIKRGEDAVYETATDAQGEFEVQLPGLPPIVLTAEVSAEDYESQTLSKGSDTKDVEWPSIRLKRLYPVTVTLVDEGDNRLSGITIDGTELDPAPVTGADGSAGFRLPSGTYQLSATDGTLSGSGTLTVTDGPAALEIVLKTYDRIWDGTVAPYYAGGSGTESDPYQISNGNQLALLAKEVNDGNPHKGDFFVLTDDIYLNDVSEKKDYPFVGSYKLLGAVKYKNTAKYWTPIGHYGISSGFGWSESGGVKAFSGTFDGRRFTVYGALTRDNHDGCGLFGYVNGGTVKNLIVSDANFSGGNGVGGIVGLLSGGVLSNCSHNGSVSGGAFVGGIAGSAQGGAVVENCTNTGYNGSLHASSEIGGIVGLSMDARISNCSNSMYVWGNGLPVGGVAGWVSGGSVRGCSNSGPIIADNYSSGSAVGKIIGKLSGGTASGNSASCEVYKQGTGLINGAKDIGMNR